MPAWHQLWRRNAADNVSLTPGCGATGLGLGPPGPRLLSSDSVAMLLQPPTPSAAWPPSSRELSRGCPRDLSQEARGGTPAPSRQRISLEGNGASPPSPLSCSVLATSGTPHAAILHWRSISPRVEARAPQSERRGQSKSKTRAATASGNAQVDDASSAAPCIPRRVAWRSIPGTSPLEDVAPEQLGSKMRTDQARPRSVARAPAAAALPPAPQGLRSKMMDDFGLRVREVRENQAALRAMTEERTALGEHCHKQKAQLDQRSREVELLHKHVLGLQKEVAQHLRKQKALHTELAIARREDTAACVICLEHSASHVVVPCGHLSLCEACCPILSDGLCPVCRQPSEKIIRVFQP